MSLLRSAIVGSAGFSHAFPTRDTPDATLLEALEAAEQKLLLMKSRAQQELVRERKEVIP